MICVETISIIVPQIEATNKNKYLDYYTNSDIYNPALLTVFFISMQISI